MSFAQEHLEQPFLLLWMMADGLGRDLFSSAPLTFCCDSAFHFLLLLYGFLTTCINDLANDCGWF